MMKAPSYHQWSPMVVLVLEKERRRGKGEVWFAMEMWILLLAQCTSENNNACEAIESTLETARVEVEEETCIETAHPHLFHISTF